MENFYGDIATKRGVLSLKNGRRRAATDAPKEAITAA